MNKLSSFPNGTASPGGRACGPVRWLRGACLAALWLVAQGSLPAQTTLLFEGFEGNFPADNGWSVGDTNPASGLAYWDDVNAAFGTVGVHSGNWKGYCAAVGNAGSIAAPHYTNNMSAYMSKTLNLAGYTGANLTFFYSIPSIETNYDFARVWVDNTNKVWELNHDNLGWLQANVSLKPYVGGSHTLKFEFYADTTVNYEGWYLDDISVTASTMTFVDTLQLMYVTNYSGYVLDSYSSGGSITPYTQYRTENFTGINTNHTNTFSYRLINGSTGYPHPIYDSNGATNTGYTFTTNMVVNLLPGTNTIVSVTPHLLPAARLDQFTQYYIECRMMSNNVVVASLTDAPYTYYHFTNLVAGDSAFNMLARLTNASWAQPYAVQSIPGQDSFQVDIGYEARRWDGVPGALASESIPMVFDYFLYDALGNFIPLTANTAVDYPAINNHGSFLVLFPSPHFVYYPSAVGLNYHLSFKPVGQLDSVSNTYYLFVRLSYTNNPTSGEVIAANSASTPYSRLLHPSGHIWFGGNNPATGGIDTAFDSESSPPFFSSVGVGFAHVWLRPDGNSGYVVGNPSHTYGDGTWLETHLFPDGHAEYVGAGSVSVTGPIPDSDSVKQVRFSRTNIVLTAGGGTGDVMITLPTGFGYRTNDVSEVKVYSQVPFPGVSLNNTLDPLADPLIFNPVGTLYTVEESKPVWFQTAQIVWRVNAGQFDLPPAGAPIYVRADEYAALFASQPSLADPSMVLKRSNERYFESVNGLSGTPIIQTDGASNAVLSTLLTFGPETFLAHYPYDVPLSWTLGGSMLIQKDLVRVGSSSVLSNVAKVKVSYSQGCPDCGLGPAGLASVSLNASNSMLSFSRDGGLVAGGPTVGTITLSWGYIAAGEYAQQAMGFKDAAFHMPGSFLRGDQNGLAADHGPVTILYTGVAVSNLLVLERPVSSGYVNGFADYAGMNFRCLTDSAHSAKSTIAGTPGITWPLTGRSKYYIRYGGVSGIHEAVSFPSTLMLYGYKFTFTHYGLNYLDNQNRDSRTDGAIYLPYPSDFTQGFDNMKFSCLGAPTSADVPQGDGYKVMKYWIADFKTLSISFASNDGCDPGQGKLVLGIEGHASHVDTPLFGSVGYETNGNLIPKSAGLAGIDSRLRLPNNFKIAGANKSTYVMTPKALAYYNNWAVAPVASTPGGGSNGWINVAGNMSLPFFRDFKIHLQTSCHTNGAAASNSTIYLSGGWPRDGSGNHDYGWSVGTDNFFNQPNFDAANNGWPSGGSVTIAKYRNTPLDPANADLYLPRAQRLWLGVVDFDYPLQWDSSLRQFKSAHPITNDLLVIKVTHQITYMDAHQASLDFGAQYDGLPKISIANLAFNALDEATGVGSCIVKAATQPVYDLINNGIDEFGQMLDTQAKRLMDGVLDRTVDPIVDQFYSQLQTDWNTLGPDQFLYNVRRESTNFLMGLGTTANSISNALLTVADGASSVNNLLGQLNTYLKNVTNAINAITGTVREGTNGIDLGGPVNGLLHKELGNFPIVSGLVTNLVGSFAGDFINAVVGPALSNVLAQAAPTLDQIVTVLNQTRDTIMEAQKTLGPLGDFSKELSDTLHSANAEIGQVTVQVSTSVEGFFNHLDYAVDDPFQHYSAAEVKQYIRQQIEDQFFASAAVANLQSVMRQRLYDLDATMKQQVDTVFQQFNGMMRDLISQSLAELDNSINGLLGEVSDVIGAGKIDGHAVIVGDSLKLLRLDGDFKFKVPDDMEVKAFLEIKELDSGGTPGCQSSTGSTTEVTLGAVDMDLGFLGSDLKATIITKFTFDSGVAFPVNLAGSLSLKGEIDFEAFQLYDLKAAMAFGKYENYLALAGGVKFDGWDFSGAIFFGRTCTLDPIKLIDPDVASVLGDPPFTGAYCYAQGWIPVSEAILGIPASCVFEISAGVGAGAFYFAEGPTYGGKMFLGVQGEFLCIVSLEADITMIGVKHGDDMAFKGHGHFEASIGPCPFCISFSKDVDISFKNKQWHID